MSEQELIFSGNIKINQRRNRVYRLYLKRFNQDEIGEMVGVTRRTINTDMKAIQKVLQKWFEAIPELAKKSLQMIKDTADSYSQIIREAWIQYHNSPNPHVKAGFLNVVARTEKQKAELLKLVAVEGTQDIDIQVLSVEYRQEIQYITGFLVEKHPELLEEFQAYMEAFVLNE